jgi:ParB/RepB/Spo0J family partition protein
VTHHDRCISRYGHTREETNLIKNIKLENIIVEERLRATKPRIVNELVRSISEIGLLNPLTVSYRPLGRKYKLEAGAHRYAAVTKLGWSEVACTVVDRSKGKVAEISENTHRADLSRLEHAEHVAALYRSYAKTDAPRVDQTRGRPRTKSAVVERMPLSGKLQAKLKRVERSLAIDELPAMVKAAAKKAKLENSTVALLKLTKLPDKQAQLALVARLEKQNAVPRPAAAKARQSPFEPNELDHAAVESLLQAFNTSGDLRKKFRKAPLPVRLAFLHSLKGIALPKPSF